VKNGNENGAAGIKSERVLLDTVAAPLVVIPVGITVVKFDGGHIACHSFKLAAECAAAS